MPEGATRDQKEAEGVRRDHRARRDQREPEESRNG